MDMKLLYVMYKVTINNNQNEKWGV